MGSDSDSNSADTSLTFSKWFVGKYRLGFQAKTVIYLVAMLLLVAIIIMKKVLSSVFEFEMIVLAIHAFVFMVEGYANFSEYVHESMTQIKDHFTDDTSSSSVLEVILVKADWCSACSMYLNGNSWQNVIDRISAVSSPSDVTFTVYDINTTEASVFLKNLKIDISSISYIPVVYIRTPEGIFLYKDNIYNSDNMVSVVMALIDKYIIS